jgi:hypothetical protein
MQAQHLLEEIFYNARVQGFGGRVRKLRVERKLQMTDVARGGYNERHGDCGGRAGFRELPVEDRTRKARGV